MFVDLITNNPGATWVESSIDDNTAITITKAATSGQRHFLSSIHSSFENTVNNKLLLTVDFGGALKFQFFIDSEVHLEFQTPIPAGENEKIDITLPASGGAGNRGVLTVTGFTV